MQGLGTTGGFKLYVQDRAARGYDELAAVVEQVLNEARKQPELLAPATYTTYQNSVPQLYAEVDRVKAKSQGILLSDIFGSMQSYLGSTYVNDFNRFGRTFRVYAQADARFRTNPEDVAELKTRNANGDMVPLGSIATVRFHDRTGSRLALQRLSRRRHQRSGGARLLLRPGHRRNGTGPAQHAAERIRL